MNDTTFAGPDLHEDFVGFDYPSYGTTVIQDAEIGASVPVLCEDGKGCFEPFCPCAAGAQLVDKTGGNRRFGCGDSSATVVTEKINITILALDLGTKCGYALRNRDGKIIHGTEAFTPRKSWTPGQRWQRFRSWLAETIATHQVHAIAYEDVKRHIGTDAAHAYGAFLALVEIAADSHRLTLYPVGVGTIKKHWTGKGNAKKDEMVVEAKRRGFRPETDNDADALAILDWAVKQEGAR